MPWRSPAMQYSLLWRPYSVRVPLPWAYLSPSTTISGFRLLVSPATCKLNSRLRLALLCYMLAIPTDHSWPTSRNDLFEVPPRHAQIALGAAHQHRLPYPEKCLARHFPRTISVQQRGPCTGSAAPSLLPRHTPLMLHPGAPIAHSGSYAKILSPSIASNTASIRTRHSSTAASIVPRVFSPNAN